DLAVARPQQVVLAVPQALHVLDAAAIELVRLERGLPKGRHPTVDLGETAVIERRRRRRLGGGTEEDAGKLLPERAEHVTPLAAAVRTAPWAGDRRRRTRSSLHPRRP